jgi:hypothetical protein
MTLQTPTRFAVAFFCSVGAAGCIGGPTQPETPLRVTLVLAPGDTAPVPATPSSLRFLGVENDSRCPADAFCITGGDAVVVLEVIEGRSARRADLHTGDMRPATVGDLTLTLQDLVPYPFSARPIQPGDYRVTIVVTR